MTVKGINATARSITVTDDHGVVVEYVLHDDTMIQVGSIPAVRLDDFQEKNPGVLPIHTGQKVRVQSRESAEHKKIATQVVIADETK